MTTAEPGKKLTIALVGNPNSGKTSLFNSLTGLRQKVGNFPGVTVDKKTGTFSVPDHPNITLIDLPGTYSVFPRSKDERVCSEILCVPGQQPDLIIVVADAANLKRNLLLCSQIMDLGIPVIVALNFLDVARSKHLTIDDRQLEKMLGIPIVPVNARKNEGIADLKAQIARMPAIPEQGFMETAASPQIARIKEITQAKTDYAALLLGLEQENFTHIDPALQQQLAGLLNEHPLPATKIQGADTLARYEKINGIVKECVSSRKEETGPSKTQALDKILTHGFWGYLIFFGLLFLIFQAIFSFASYPMDWIESAFIAISQATHQTLPDAWYTDLLVEGLLAGIGGVVIFIPQIMILFGFITLLEDSGYMARASFLMDKLMQKIGLNGKSVIPLISGVACAVPAVMAARNISNDKERLITILVTPLMSCSARLPVYTLLIALVVPDQTVLGFFNLQGLMLMGLYLLGLLMAIVVAAITRLLIRSKEKGFFILEMPVYQLPRMANVFMTMIEKAKIFTVEAGKVIVVISIVLWALASYGPGNQMEAVEGKYEHSEYRDQYSGAELAAKIQSEKLTHSYAGHLGRFIEPVIQPLGFDWKIGIALIASFAAREVFVGTMATIYSAGGDEENILPLKQKMALEVRPGTDQPVYSFATALSLMLFYAFAMQCMSTVAVMKRETKGWKWPMVQLTYMTLLAYFSSLVAFQLLS